MCEANVYIDRGSGEELFMEKVDRIIPGEENNIFMESIFGERRVVKARIREMELVHHRIVLEEIKEDTGARNQEIWLEPATEHGHFHEGEEVSLRLLKGFNMKADTSAVFQDVQVFVVNEGIKREVSFHEHDGEKNIVLGQEADGLIQLYANEEDKLYGKLIVEIGHHHHHGLQPLGLPLEIVPSNYSHARMGESYEIQVLKDGKPLPGIGVRATYSGTHNRDYPHHLTTDSEGKTRLFLTARGNYLFTVNHDGIISTFTLMKSF
jgi:predicted RNA-binding protein